MSQITDELLPCPFCGKAPQLQDFLARGAADYVEISCGHPVEEGPDGFDAGSSCASVTADTLELAIAAWNRRSTPPVGAETVTWRPSYEQISTMVHACRERQKAAGEGDQMLSRWISEGLDGLAPPRSDNANVDWVMVRRDVAELLADNNKRYTSEWWSGFNTFREMLLTSPAVPNTVGEDKL